jgi:hypothetical protein
LRRRQQARKNWRGAKGGEKNKLMGLDQRCKIRKMFPLNPRIILTKVEDTILDV